MKILWLGQAGLLFVSGKTKIMIDPYLSDSLSKYNHEFARRLKVNKKLFKVKPDAIIITNSHSDHADADTIEKLLKKKKKKSDTTILSCKNVFNELVEIPIISQANNIMLEEGSEWTIDNLNICAVSAKTDDESAFGVIITDTTDNKKYYITGDTLYNKHIFKELPDDIFAMFLPINGKYGSMNIADAKRFALEVDSEYCVPIHFGMFDKIDAFEFNMFNAIVPKPYKIISFDESKDVPYRKQLDSRFNEKITANTNNDDSSDATGEEVAVIPSGSSVNDTSDDIDEVINDEVAIEADINEDSVPVANNEESADNTAIEADTNNEAQNINNIEINAEAETEPMIEDEIEPESNIEKEDDATSENIPFEAGDWESYVSSENEATGDNESDSSVASDDTTEDDNSSATSKVTIDESDKIDAYIREIEKFERGETTDFSKID